MTPEPHVEVFTFIQTVQSIAPAFLEPDLTKRLPTVWDALAHAPCCRSDDERAVFALVIGRVAVALFDNRPHQVTVRARLARGSLWNIHSASALEFLFRNFSNSDLNLRTVAAHCQVSVPYLSRLVRLTTRYGLHSHLRGVRLLFAVRLLADATLSIKEVASRSGYKTTAALDHEFRERLFMTPSEFRQLTW